MVFKISLFFTKIELNDKVDSSIWDASESYLNVRGKRVKIQEMNGNKIEELRKVKKWSADSTFLKIISYILSVGIAPLIFLCIREYKRRQFGVYELNPTVRKVTETSSSTLEETSSQNQGNSSSVHDSSENQREKPKTKRRERRQNVENRETEQQNKNPSNTGIELAPNSKLKNTYMDNPFDYQGKRYRNLCWLNSSLQFFNNSEYCRDLINYTGDDEGVIAFRKLYQGLQSAKNLLDAKKAYYNFIIEIRIISKKPNYTDYNRFSNAGTNPNDGAIFTRNLIQKISNAQVVYSNESKHIFVPSLQNGFTLQQHFDKLRNEGSEILSLPNTLVVDTFTSFLAHDQGKKNIYSVTIDGNMHQYRLQSLLECKNKHYVFKTLEENSPVCYNDTAKENCAKDFEISNSTTTAILKRIPNNPNEVD